MNFEAVIWDFGGVITSSPFEAFNRYEAERGIPHNLIRQINAANPDSNAWALLERSEIDSAEFDTRFAEEAKARGFDIPGADVLALLSGAIRPRVVAAIDQIKVYGLTVACITNNAKVGQGAGMTSSPEKAQQIAAIMDRFDHIIESSKAGVRKPDPRIYEMMCQALSIDAAKCVYLDDLGINCKPAAALGMHAIKVTGEDQALADLGAALDMTFA